MMQYTIQHLAHVAVTGSDYNIYLSVCLNTHRLHIFKYNDHCCEYEQFDDQEAACLYIAQPLPDYRSKRY